MLLAVAASLAKSQTSRQPESRTPTSDSTRELIISYPNPECEEQRGSHFHDVPSLSGSATHTDESKEMIITSIRATDLAVGLRRIPVGFYAAVQHSGCEWRTENKSDSLNNNVVIWDGFIPIPSNPSATICLGIYASCEFKPMLGDGEQLRKVTVSVEQLLNRCGSGLPFIFFPKDGDTVSPCSSIFLTVRRWKRESGDLLAPRLLDSRRQPTELLSQLEEATNQGHSALSRYRNHEDERDLERSINHFQHALNICPFGHPCRAAAESNLAMAKFIHCRVANTNTSFDVPLVLYRNVLTARPIGHPDRPFTLVHLATVHFARFEQQRDGFDVTQAEALLLEAMDLSCAESASRRAAYFLLQLQTVDDVQESRRLSVGWDSAPGITGDDLWNASVQLVGRFERFGDLADLQQAISLLDGVVRSTSVWDHTHLLGLTGLGAALAHRFERLGELRDLERSISVHRDAAGFTPNGSPDKPHRLSHLGGTLALRFQHLGQLRDLEEAISNLRHAIDLSPVGDPVCLNHLGISLLSRFQHLGERSDLEESILRLKDADNLTPHGHLYKSICSANLAVSLLTRFQCLGDLGDIEEAILRQRNAIDHVPDDHVRRSSHLNNLGFCFFLRFERLGDLSDLTQAISRLMEAVDLTPDGHPRKPGRLNNLGSSLFSRFMHLKELSDLEQAISTLEIALNLIPDGYLNRHFLMNNLGICFKSRFDYLQEVHDIEKAASILMEAVHITPDGHTSKPNCLCNLGDALRTRFYRRGELDDLEQAISRLRDAVDLTPHAHPSKPDYLNYLGNTFLTRFQHLGELSDLEQTISSYMKTVDLVPNGHPSKPGYLYNLGIALLCRFERLREPCDLGEAMSHFSDAARASTGPTTRRFCAAREWISCARILRHRSLLDAYSIAIGLLPQLAWIGFSLTGRYLELKKGADVVREAAAAALDAGDPETAVEWLEQGRSIVWGELFQLRSSFEDLSSAHPDHAYRLRELSVALEHAGAAHEKRLSLLSEQAQISDHRAMMSLDQEINKHRALAVARDKLLQEIRNLPGFERFLLCKKFSQLRASARSGPVVVLNAAETRCDALIVLAGVDHVIHVPLPSFTLERCKGLQTMLRSLLGPSRSINGDARVGKPATRGCVSWESVLSTLWNGIAKPVLEALAISIPGNLLRVFWCPTGPFAFLPIHAAGLYGTRTSDLGQKLSDFIVSSYIPTLSIILPPLKSDAAPREGLRLLAVRQPPSDGQFRLPGVDIELRYIKAAVQSSPPARVTLSESSIGTVDEVLALMKDADWVHFACHGIQDAAEPVHSGLCLADQCRLKLCDVISISRPRGGLAFLSACQTATGHKDLSDEAVHIAAGMLFAGFGGVIGTMWSISDRLAPRVAGDVYEQLFCSGTRPDYRDAARALHYAVGRLQDSNASFVEWLPFIHVGL